MSSSRSVISESDVSRLRIIVAGIDRALSCLSLAGTADEHSQARQDLSATWGQLVELLDLGPAPLVRQCPVCGKACMRAATLCGHCWTKLSAPPALPS